VPFVRDVWVALTDLGRALNTNLGGGAEFSLAKYLSAKVDGKPEGTKYLWEELQEEVADDLADTALEGDFDFPAALPDLEDWLHLDPKAYFDGPVALRNMLPAITALEIGNKIEYEFALECELGFTAEQFAEPSVGGGLAADSTIRTLCADGSTGKSVRLKTVYFYDNMNTDVTTDTGFVAESGDAPFDFKHFMGFAVSDTAVAAAAALPITKTADMVNLKFIKPLTFAEGLGAPGNDTLIQPDGYWPATHTADSDPHDDVLLSVLMQNASFGGALLIDLEVNPATAGAVVANNSILNALISQVWITFGGHIEALVDGLSD
jgi:hypothetical protein